MIKASAPKSRIEASGLIDITCDAEPAEITAGEGEGSDQIRFSMNLYGGGPMSPAGWMEAHPIVVDISGIQFPKNQTVPALVDHQTNQIAGHTTEISAGNKLQVKGIVSGANIHATEVVASSKNGFPWQASLGASITSEPEFVAEGKNVNVNGRRQAGPVFVARNTRLREASFVSIGADSSTSAVAATKKKESNMDPKFEAWVNKELDSLGVEVRASDLKAAALVTWQVKYDSWVEATAPADPIVKAKGGDEPAMVNPLEAQAAQYERASVIQAKLGLHPELAAKACLENWSDDRIDAELTKKELAALRESVGTGPGAGVSIHSKNSDLTAEAIECAMFQSYLMDEKATKRNFSDKAIEATRDLQQRKHLPRSPSLKFLLHETIRGSGQFVNPGTTTDDDVIRTALTIDNRIRAGINGGITAGAGISTMSVSGILSNFAHKLLLESFSAVPTTFREFSIIRSHSNFKEHRKYRTYGMQDLEEVGRGGEIKHTTLKDATYTNRLDTHARMMSLTRQDMIDDDLDAFSKIPQGFGDVAARTLEKSVYTELLENAGDFFTLTPTGHGINYQTTASALSATTLESAKVLFATQVDEDGNPVLLSPELLLTGENTAETARSLLQMQTIVGADTSFEVANQWLGRYKPVSTPWLDVTGGLVGGSDTVWFLLGGSATYRIMEVAFLNGQATPTLESDDTDFNVLGRQWRVFYDWGVTKFEPRAGVKSTGAAA